MEVMMDATELMIRWGPLISVLVPDECIQGDSIFYSPFLNSINKYHRVRRSSSREDGEVMMDALYANRKKLEVIFQWFDLDGNGKISREEFRQGCDILNETLDSDHKLRDYDRVLDMMDFDHSDDIDLNEFFEVFRIVDARDGTLDGEIRTEDWHS